MSITAFYGIVSGINFTLLGLWWVAARENLIGRGASGRRTGYLVSLQFVIPGTISLLSQVAPEVPALWRVSFAIAGVLGAIGMIMLGPMVGDLQKGPLVAAAVLFGAAPIYALVAIVAALPGLPRTLGLSVTSLQIEGVLLTLLVLLGTQIAWAVHMAPVEPKP